MKQLFKKLLCKLVNKRFEKKNSAWNFKDLKRGKYR